MKRIEEKKRTVEWAGRINKRWIVHHGLGEKAESWLEYLAATDEARLRESCETAREMIARWSECGDPKPWFYSGLFHLATEEEAKRFLKGHRLTTATVPAMHEDTGVKEWEEELCDETVDLLEKLRDELKEAMHGKAKP